MKAIILAAGVGRRLSPITDKTPKALIEIGGKTLIERHLTALKLAGINDIVLVVGHLKELVERKLAEIHSGERQSVKYIHNPRYEMGSVISLWCAREELEGGALVMDADVLSPAGFLSKLLNSKNESCFLMDTSKKSSGEEMMISASKSRVIKIMRGPDPNADEVGEGVGFLKVGASHVGTLKRVLDDFVDNSKNNADYEDALDEWLKLVDAGYEPVSGLPWTEIDFEEDLRKAEKLVELIDR